LFVLRFVNVCIFTYLLVFLFICLAEVYMNLLDAFYATVSEYPGGAESLAPRIGMSAQILRNKANVNSVTNKVSIDEFDRVLGVTGDFRALHALAAAHGFAMVPLVAGAEASDGALVSAMARQLTMAGEFGAAINSALADGRVDKHEAADVEEKAHAAATSVMDIAARMKGMAQ
jgi:hypothetical protein